MLSLLRFNAEPTAVTTAPPPIALTLPVGPYSSHATTLQSLKYVDLTTPGYMARGIERRARSAALLGGNVVWFTNLPADPVVIELYVRIYRQYGMEIIAGSGEWYAYASRPGAYGRLRAVYDALPADARPYMWTLGDETAPGDIAALAALAQQCRDGGIPATMTQVPEYHANTLTALSGRLSTVTCDYYPIRVPGLPTNPPYGAAALTTFINICQTTTTRAVAGGVRPVMMTQGYGDNTLFALPTPAQTEWQIWISLLNGSRGSYVFIHGMPSPDNIAPAPPSLVDWRCPGDETLTPQGQAVAAAYRRLPTVATWFAQGTAETKPTPMTSLTAGDGVGVLRTADGRRLLVVVADPLQPKRSHILRLPGTKQVTPLAQSQPATVMTWPWPWSLFIPTTVTVEVAPGSAWLGELR